MSSLLNNLSIDVLATGLIVAALFSVLAAILAISIAINRSRQRKAERLSRVCNRLSGKAVVMPGTSALRNNKENSAEKLMLRYLPNMEKLSIRLELTGREIRPGMYLIVIGALSFFTMFVFIGLLKSSIFVSLLMGLAVGISLPHMVTSMMISRRRNAFLTNFPEAIDIMVRGLKAGLPVTESINAVSRESVEPVRSIFGDIADKIKVGENMEDAIMFISGRMGVPEFKFLAITLSVQKETGGNLAETLGNLSDILRKRRQMKLKVKAVSSEARASAMILGSLPFVMFCLIFLVSNEYIMGLFTDPRGHMLMAIGLILMAVGGGIMAKMVRFEI